MPDSEYIVKAMFAKAWAVAVPHGEDMVIGRCYPTAAWMLYADGLNYENQTNERLKHFSKIIETIIIPIWQCLAVRFGWTVDTFDHEVFLRIDRQLVSRYHSFLLKSLAAKKSLLFCSKH